MKPKSAISIDGREISGKQRPFIIAEMSGNHNQSLNRALEIVKAAAASGADALKIQTYTPDTMTIDVSEREFFISDPASLWKGSSLYELYAKAHTPWEWHSPIFDLSKSLGMIPFSTPFDSTAVDFLESLDPPCYKVASFENTDLALIRRVAKTGKPLIVSTGMATVAELDETVRTAGEAGCKQLVLLKCTSAYPATPKDANILTIPHLRALFDCEVGLSDHTKGIGVAVASVALGATVIEKHFTVARQEGGVDSAFSLEPDELRQLVAEAERAWQALGRVTYGLTKVEEKAVQFRRSLYIVDDVRAGEKLTEDNVRAIRPGFGLPPKYLEKVLGRHVSTDVKRGTALTWELLD